MERKDVTVPMGARGARLERLFVENRWISKLILDVSREIHRCAPQRDDFLSDDAYIAFSRERVSRLERLHALYAEFTDITDALQQQREL